MKYRHQTGGLIRSVLIFALAALPAALSDATEGTYLHGHGPIQRSRTGAGVASPRDASWMILNPAGLVELERRVDIGLDIALSDVTLDPGGLIGNPFTGEMTDSQYFFIPSLGMVWPTERGVAGVGLYVPSGIGDDFPHSRNILSQLFHGNADRRLEFQQFRLVWAYGRKFDNGWALGFGVNVSVSRARSDSLTLDLTPTDGDNEWDYALGAGFNLGVYKKWDRFAFGASYQSRQWSERFHDYEDLLRYPLDLPHIIQVGVAYDVTPKLELVLDYKFIHWTSSKLAGKLPTEGGFGWQDQHIVKFGLEWRINNAWTFRAGYSHGNSPLVEEHVFINGLPSTSVIERHLGFGVSYAFGEHSEVHLTFVRAFDRELTGKPGGDILSWLGAGTKAGLGHDGVTLGYTYRF